MGWYREPICGCDPVCEWWRRCELTERAYERAHDAWLQARFAYRKHLDEVGEAAAA